MPVIPYTEVPAAVAADLQTGLAALTDFLGQIQASDDLPPKLAQRVKWARAEATRLEHVLKRVTIPEGPPTRSYWYAFTAAHVWATVCLRWRIVWCRVSAKTQPCPPAYRH